MQRRNDLVVIEKSIKILVFMLPPPPQYWSNLREIYMPEGLLRPFSACQNQQGKPF